MDGTLTKVTRNGQVTLPKAIRDLFGIEEGDYVEVEVEDDRVILTPKKLIDASQAYFWSQSWQAAEQEASQDVAAGRTRDFDEVEDFIASLRKSREGK